MKATWHILSVLLFLLVETKSEQKNDSDNKGIAISKEEYSVYDFLGSTTPKIPSILNFKTWSEDEIKFHRKLIVLIYYSKQNCLQCAQRERVLEEVIERFHPQVEFYRFNCDSEFDPRNIQEDDANTRRYKVGTCHKNYPEQLPTVSFIAPEQDVFFPYDPMSFKEPQYEPDFSDPNSLSDMISSYMPIYAKKIKNMEEANNFIEKFGHLSKAFYFLNSEEPPIYFKGLTAAFKDKLEVDTY